MSKFIVNLFSVNSNFSITTAPMDESQVKSLMHLTRDVSLTEVHLPSKEGEVIVINKEAMQNIVFTYKIFEITEEEEQA